MKTSKRLFILLLIVIIALPIISYVGIVLTNNSIADKIEKNLTSYELPADTELIDSISVAGKLTGNGNGMQYMGAILVDSDLSKDELEAYYLSEFEFIEVKEQETSDLDFIQNVSFDAVINTGDNTYYSIICWDDDRKEMFGNLISELLDFDIRGH